jgi:hypothetical protein
MDILKEKLGNAILPMITDFVDQISKPGGLVDQVGKFLDDLSNPKTEAGATFKSIKDAVGQTIEGVKQFFALFGGGDAMKGFANVAGSLVRMLPALLALKGIMFLAQAGSAIKNLVAAVALIRGKTSLPANNPLNDAANSPIGTSVKGILITQAAGQYFSDINEKNINSKLNKKGLNVALSAASSTGTMAIPTGKGSDFLGIGNNSTTNITVNVHSADPKAVVDAVSTYVKTNGSVPSAWGTGGRR